MAVNSGEDREGSRDVSLLSDGSRTIPEWKSPNFSEAQSLNSHQQSCHIASNSQYIACVEIEDLDIHNPSNLDLDVEKGRLEILKPNDTFGVLKSEDSWTGTLRRKIGLHVGEKFMQLLANNGLELPKFMSRDKSMTDRIFDTPTSRSRKCKRSASFNSRKVVLLFSVLSSVGTVVLIFLTLRLTSNR